MSDIKAPAKPKNKDTKIGCLGCGGLILVLAVCGLILSISDKNDSRSSKNDSDTATNILSGNTPEEQLGSLAKVEFTENLRRAYILDATKTRFAIIEYDMPLFWDEESACRNFAYAFSRTTQMVFQIKGIDCFQLSAYTQYRDLYGKDHEGLAFQFSISREIDNQINWSQFDKKNLPLILNRKDGDNTFIIWPAFQDKWFNEPY